MYDNFDYVAYSSYGRGNNTYNSYSGYDYNSRI